MPRVEACLLQLLEKKRTVGKLGQNIGLRQFEHTMVVTDDGAELLTLHPDGRWSGDGGQPGDPPS